MRRRTIAARFSLGPLATYVTHDHIFVHRCVGRRLARFVFVFSVLVLFILPDAPLIKEGQARVGNADIGDGIGDGGQNLKPARHLPLPSHCYWCGRLHA